MQMIETVQQSGEECGFQPILIKEIELSQPLPRLSLFDENTGYTYHSLRCIVRLHGQPLGQLDLSLDSDILSPHEAARAIWQVLNQQINEHLRQDGLPEVLALSEPGLPYVQLPACIREREAFLLTAPFVSVVVATHDRPDVLARCVRNLLDSHYRAFEIIVVDNAPTTAKTAELITSLSQQYAQLHYVREDNPGPACARNRGIREARGEIIAFVDDDVIIDPYWLLQTAKAFTKADKVACVTSLVLPAELETQSQAWFEAYGGFSRGFILRIFDRQHGGDTAFHPFMTGWFGTGAGMAFTADFFRRYGGFDPALSTGEDIAEFFRVIILGYKIVYEPAALLYHQHRRTYEGLRKQISSYGTGFTAYLTKCLIDRPWLIFRLIFLVLQSILLILRPVTVKHKPRSAEFPAELSALEKRAMRKGPYVYITRRWKTRRLVLPPAAQRRR